MVKTVGMYMNNGVGGKSDWEFGINIVFKRECCCSDGKLWYNLMR